jgi:hypothetical protein
MSTIRTGIRLVRRERPHDAGRIARPGVVWPVEGGKGDQMMVMWAEEATRPSQAVAPAGVEAEASAAAMPPVMSACATARVRLGERWVVLG